MVKLTGIPQKYTTVDGISVLYSLKYSTDYSVQSTVSIIVRVLLVVIYYGRTSYYVEELYAYEYMNMIIDNLKIALCKLNHQCWFADNLYETFHVCMILSEIAFRIMNAKFLHW